MRDAEALGEAEGRHAVDDAEIDRLGLPAQVRRHLGRAARRTSPRRSPRGCRCRRAKACLQLRDVGDMREHAQLDLAVIGRDDLVARRRDEGGADLAPGLRADRDVLQVRIRRGQPARRRRGERVARCAPASVSRMHVLLQRVGIGRFQLRELAPFENLLRQLVARLRQFVENVARRRPLARTASSSRRAGPSCRTGCRRSASASRARTSRRRSPGSRPRGARASGRNRPTAGSGSAGRRRCRASPCGAITSTSGRSSVS